MEQKDFENGSVETMDNHAWKIALRDLAWEDHISEGTFTYT